jgi:hypothetical protein
MVCAGAVSQTTAGTHPAILDRLGPVKAASLRVASRAANAIRAGTPVAVYEDLAPVSTILISVPDAEVQGITAELAAASLRWKNKTVVLADSQFDSAVLEPLATLGASTGSFNMLTEFGQRKFLLEGNARAVRTVRGFLETSNCRAIVIDTGTKARYFAAVDFLAFSLTAMLIAGSEALRRSGLRSLDLHSVLEGASTEALRTYLKAGKNALANIETDMFRHHLASLENTDKDLAEYYKEVLASADRYRRVVPVDH